MSDLNLFKLSDKVEEIFPSSANIEKELQSLIEKNMEIFFGVRFLQTEYTTTHGGRIDSLGVDENNCPVIFEYKRATNHNVINQGLFYLDWLMDHKADFELLVMRILGKEYSEKLDWSMPRLICVAGDFTKFDVHAVNQIPKKIDLIRYKKYGNDLILFELINSNAASPNKETSEAAIRRPSADKTFTEQLQSTDKKIEELYYSIRDYIMALGDDVTENQLKLYVAFKKIKNIVCAEVRYKCIMLYLRVNPELAELENGFSRDVREIGHWGTGELELTIKNIADFEKAKKYIDMAYTFN